MIVRVCWVISSVLAGLRMCLVVSRTFWVNTNVLGDVLCKISQSTFIVLWEILRLFWVVAK